MEYNQIMMAQTVFCVCNPIESVAVCLKLNDTSQIVITYKTVLFDFCCHLFSANIKKKISGIKMISHSSGLAH